MENIKIQIEKVKKIVEDLENQGIYIDINIDDVEDVINNPEEYVSEPSSFVDDAMFIVDNIREDISKLYKALDKLQDMLYEKNL